MEDSDLVFYEENGETKSVGYKVNNSLINRMPAMVMSGGGKGSKKGGGDHLQKTYAVPAGLYLLHGKIHSTPMNNQVGGKKEEVGVIGEDLYDRLLALAGPHPRRGRKKASHKTRKNRRTSKRNTRKR